MKDVLQPPQNFPLWSTTTTTTGFKLIISFLTEYSQELANQKSQLLYYPLLSDSTNYGNQASPIKCDDQ